MAISAVYAPVQAEVILTVRRWARNEAWEFSLPGKPMTGLKLRCLMILDHKLLRDEKIHTEIHSTTKLCLTKPY